MPNRAILVVYYTKALGVFMNEDFYYENDVAPDSTSEVIETVYKEDDTINLKSTKWN